MPDRGQAKGGGEEVWDACTVVEQGQACGEERGLAWPLALACCLPMSLLL